MYIEAYFEAVMIQIKWFEKRNGGELLVMIAENTELFMECLGVKLA